MHSELYDTPDPSPENSSEEEEEEEEETAQSESPVIENKQENEIPEATASEPSNKPIKVVKKNRKKVPMTPERAAAVKRAKAIAKKKKKQQMLKEKRQKRAENTEALPGGGRVSDAYAFTGMHHIWDEHHEAGKFLLSCTLWRLIHTTSY